MSNDRKVFRDSPPSSPIRGNISPSSGDGDSEEEASDSSGRVEPSSSPVARTHSPGSSPVRPSKRPYCKLLDPDHSEPAPKAIIQEWTETELPSSSTSTGNTMREMSQHVECDQFVSTLEMVSNEESDLVSTRFSKSQSFELASTSSSTANVTHGVISTEQTDELESTFEIDNDVESELVTIQMEDDDDHCSDGNPSSVISQEEFERMNIHVDSSNEEFSDSGSVGSRDSNDFEETEYLYQGCKKTTDSVILEFLEIHIRFKSKKNHLAELLKFFVSCLPADHNMPVTLTRLFKYVENLAPPVKEVRHNYCVTKTNMHIMVENSKVCEKCPSSEVNHFFEMPIGNQLKFLFEHRGLSDIIASYQQKRDEVNEEEICDILDGSEYSRVWNGSKQTNFNQLTLILNTDGVQPHDSSSAKFWPLLFTVMELPPPLRPLFIIVAGVWFDKLKKPDMDMFLKPFVMSLKKLFEDGGVSWTHPVTGEKMKTQVLGPIIVADGPARAAVQGIQEHNSKYACNTCEQKSVLLPRPPPVEGKKQPRAKRRFLFKEEPSKLRTHERMVAQGQLALRYGLACVKGVKHPSIVKELPMLDLSTCVVAEYMHSTLKGVASQFLQYWLFSKGPWYIGKHLDEMNNFMSSIHPPDFITRLPRLFDVIALWKANELRAWLLFYSLVILSRVMPKEYVQHWILFVSAIFILLQDKISASDLNAAEIMLRMFIRDVRKLYGELPYVYNLHQTLHLCLYVRRWGPLWATSAFPFEDFNGVLARMFHGTKNQGQELINQIKLAQGVQMLRGQQKLEEREKVEMLGKSLHYDITPGQESVFEGLLDKNMQFYGRVSLGKNNTLSSQVYDHNMKRHNSYVEFYQQDQKSYGRVIVFCRVDDTTLCLLEVYNICHTKLIFHQSTRRQVTHLLPIVESGKYVLCHVNQIVQKLIRVGDYICMRPNTVEVNL